VRTKRTLRGHGLIGSLLLNVRTADPRVTLKFEQQLTSVYLFSESMQFMAGRGDGVRFLLLFVVTTVLFTGCSSGPREPKPPEYGYAWDKSAIPKADRELLEVECELVGFDASNEYKRANPITNNWQNTAALKTHLRDGHAKDFGSKAERACLLAAGYKRVTRCIKYCN